MHKINKYQHTSTKDILMFIEFLEINAKKQFMSSSKATLLEK